jgi:hypothetical protein
VNETANVRSIYTQSMSAASLTSGCSMLIAGPGTKETFRPFAAAKAWTPSDSPERFARKQLLAKPHLANAAAFKPKKYESFIHCAARHPQLMKQESNNGCGVWHGGRCFLGATNP